MRFLPYGAVRIASLGSTPGSNCGSLIQNIHMPKGTIKWFDQEKGYGFIQQSEGGDDLFVHHSETDGYALNEGDSVEFEIGEGRKGPCATKVQKV